MEKKGSHVELRIVKLKGKERKKQICEGHTEAKRKKKTNFLYFPLEHDGCPRLGYSGLNTCSGCSGQWMFSQ